MRTRMSELSGAVASRCTCSRGAHVHDAALLVRAAIEAAVAAHRPKLLFLTSPNNPDGSLVAEADLLRLLRLPLLVVLDEAYIEFSECAARALIAGHRQRAARLHASAAGLAGTGHAQVWRRVSLKPAAAASASPPALLLATPQAGHGRDMPSS